MSSAPLFETRLARLIDAADQSRLAGNIAVVRHGARLQVEVAIDLDQRHLGERHFEVKDCEHAAETAAVAASLAVFAGAGEPQGASESGISPDIWTQRPDPVPDFRPARAPTPPPPAPLLEPRLGVLGVAKLGALPKLSLGGGLLVELGLAQRWSLGALAGVTAEQERVVNAGQSAALRVFDVAGRACGAPIADLRLRMDGCVGLRYVVVHGRGEGFDVNREASLQWLEPFVGVEFSVRAPSYVEWRLGLAGSAPLSRHRFLVDASELSRAAALGLDARLGPVLRF